MCILQEFGKLVKEAIREAGGVPFEFNTIGVDDGIAMGHIGMRYSLAKPRDYCGFRGNRRKRALVRRHGLHSEL